MMIEVEDRSAQLRERRIRKAAQHIAKIPAETPLALLPTTTTKPCVYRIALTPRGHEERRWFVRSFEGDEAAQMYALGRNIAATSDEVYVVVRRGA